MLPIDDHLPAIQDALRRARAVVVTAAPGAGKTTRVPPALVADGPVLLLQPRRVAARAITRRIAEERGWTVGEEVGWQVRFERRASARTQLLVVTEGVLTASAQRDPLLSAWRTIVVDEFHERSIHADLGLAFARQAWHARDDLRIVVMSATIDAARIAGWLDDCPVITVPGRLHPVTTSYHPGASVVEIAEAAAASHRGAVLCFLPGAADIARAQAALTDRWPVFPLHGRLDADAQDLALRPSPTTRIVLATNVAETTITVPDVTAVVDTGLQKVARYDASRALDSLVTERISMDSAEQRAGRAGRVREGAVYRLWDARDRLRPQREPEIARVDLAGPLLDILTWGGDAASFEWCEAPPAWRIDAALQLLRRLGAVDDAGRLTPVGRRCREWSLPPRLARLFLSAGETPDAARICAALADGVRLPAARAGETRASDVEVFTDAGVLPPGTRQVAQALAGRRGDGAGRSLAEAVLHAYPDRVARRRAGRRDAYLLATGTGAVLSRDSGVRDAEWIVAVDVAAGDRPGAESIIRLASSISPEWLTPTSEDVEHVMDDVGRVAAVRRRRYDALILDERPAAIDPEVASALVLEAWRAAPRSEAERRLAARLQCAGVVLSLEEMASRAAEGVSALQDLDVTHVLPHEAQVALQRFAPETLRVPSGRDLRLDYRDDGSVVVSVKLQEVFGLADSPTVGRVPVPVTFELLAPNQRPVQVTRDLRSFWSRGYPEVRRELRGRYPRHPWPEDPWDAPPTHRAKPRNSTRG